MSNEENNPLWKLIELFPNRPWNWYAVCRNPLTSLDTLERFAESGDPRLDWEGAIRNPNVTEEFCEKYADRYPSKETYYRHAVISIDALIAGNPNDEEFITLSRNKNIRWRHVEAFPSKPWSYRLLSENHSIPLEVIERDPSRWDFVPISKRPDITIDFVKRHLDRFWDWAALSAHRNITYEDVVSNKELGWQYKHLSRNPNLTADHLCRLRFILGLRLDVMCPYPYYFSLNETLTIKEVREINEDAAIDEEEYAWDMEYLSSNPSISVKDILECPEMKWSWRWVSKKESLKWTDVAENPDQKWDWFGGLSNNTFGIGNEF